MAVKFSEQKRSLLDSDARIQVPFVSATIGKYTFGVYTREASDTVARAYNVQYPRYITQLQVIKINGQVNQYTLSMTYPITVTSDPNFMEKVFSSVSSTRKIVFTYGDCAKPEYIYKQEEAIITKIDEQFNLEGSSIVYTVHAISGAALKTLGCSSYPARTAKPSDIIKELFRQNSTGLKDTFTGMSEKLLDVLIAGDDQAVALDMKVNISVIDYITYLVSCMIPIGQTKNNISTDIYILTMHDDTVYDQLYNEYGGNYGGPYFKVTKTSYLTEQSDAYEVYIGFNNSNIVRGFTYSQNENYSIYYDYQEDLVENKYVRRVGNDGKVEEIYSPSVTSKNEKSITRANDISWWTKITKYPVKATIQVQGLLKPAHLMTYLRLHVIFHGKEHISSGLYIVTKQTDTISPSNGYVTQLDLTKISGDGERYFPD